MIYKYIEKASDKLIVLLHGTGGNELSLLELGQIIDQNASLLGIRGNVNEKGMNRFFKRIKPGLFDLESLISETHKLKSFINQFLSEKTVKYDDIVILGYSNGANIIGSLIFHYGKMFKGVAMLHPMVPIKNFLVCEQNSQKIFISASINDPIVDLKEAITLEEMLVAANADILMKWYSSGHEISNEEITDLKKWYNKL